ncbi:hypothetical protein AC624_25940 [Bacillus sp. FJAT-27238]|nr:hypothetical protein AC624_25940 [Bacillus sp. FJAT-27238]
MPASALMIWRNTSSSNAMDASSKFAAFLSFLLLIQSSCNIRKYLWCDGRSSQWKSIMERGRLLQKSIKQERL